MSYLRFADAFPNPQPKKDKDDPLAFLDPPKPNVPAPQSGHIRFSDAFPNPVKEEKSDPLAFLNQQTPTQPDKPKGPNLWQKMWQGIGKFRKSASEVVGKATDRPQTPASSLPAILLRDAAALDVLGTPTWLRMADHTGMWLAAQMGTPAQKAAIMKAIADEQAVRDRFGAQQTQAMVDVLTLGLVPKRDEAVTTTDKLASGVGTAMGMLIPFSGGYSVAGGAARASARAAPRVLGKPVAQEILKGTVAGALQGGGDALIRSEGDLRQAGVGAAVGAGLGGTLGGVAGGISHARATAPVRRFIRNVEGEIVRQPTSRTFRVVSQEQKLDDVLQQIQPKVEQRLLEFEPALEGQIVQRPASRSFRVVHPEQQLENALQKIQPKVEQRLFEAQAARRPPLERKPNLVKYIRDEMPDFSRKQLERLSYDDLVELATEIGQRKPLPSVQQLAREEAAKIGIDLDKVMARAARAQGSLSELAPNHERVRLARAAGVMPTDFRRFLNTKTEIVLNNPTPNVAQLAREEAAKLGYDLDLLLSRASRERPLREFVPSRPPTRLAQAAGVFPTGTRRFLDEQEVIQTLGQLRKGSRLKLKDGNEAIVSSIRDGKVHLGVFERKPDGKVRFLHSIEVTPEQLGATIREASETATRTLPETQARLGTLLRRPTSTTSTAPGEIVSRRDIVRVMSERLGIPIRQGGFNTQRGQIKGFYRVRGEGIRVASANDIETVAHEVGHHLDKQLGLVEPRFDDELMAIGQLTSGEGYSPASIRAEGVAEFVNWYVTDPEYARKAAPRYFAEFDKRIKADKQLSAMFKEVKDMYAAWKALPPEQQILSQISTSPAKQKRTLGKLAGDLNTAIWDELAPIQRAVEDMTGGQALNISEDPFQQAWLARGWAGKAETALEYGLMDRNFNKIGPSFREIIKPVAKDLDNFRAYATARRVLELENRGIHTGFDVARERKIVEKFRDNKLFNETFDKVIEYQDQLLEMLVESGIYTRTDVANMKAKNKEYLPFYRVFEEIEKQQLRRVSGKGFADVDAPVKRITGSDRDIIDPLESIIKDTYYFTNLAERNKVGRLLAELADNPNVHGASKWIEEVDPTKGTLANVIAVWRDGQKRFYQVDPDLYRAMKFLDEESTNVLVKFLAPLASVRRAGATLDPRFWLIRNPFRDQLDAYVFSNYGFRPGIDLVSGMLSVLKRDDLYWKWKASGGANSILSTMDRNHLQRSLKRMAGLSGKEKLKTILNPVEMMRSFSSVFEEATRVGEFKRGFRAEKGLRDGVMRAALSSRDVTLDFARRGTKTSSLNRVIPFFNAALQEPSKIARSFKQNPKRTTIKALTGITMPTIGLYMVNRENPEYWKRAQWERDTFWLIPIDGGKDFFRIPKPFLMGQLFGTIPERIMNFVEKEDPKAFKDLHKSLKDSAFTGFLPAGVDTYIELMTNYSLFQDRPIVPESEQDLEPRLQYGTYTSDTAKAIGDMFNVSPRKVEHAVRGTFAGLGQLAMGASDAVLGATGAVDRAPGPSPTRQDHALAGALFSQTGGTNSQFITDFYDGLNELRRERNSARRVLNDVEDKLKTGQQIPQKDIDLIRRARANEEALREQEAVAKELSELRKSLNELHLSREHTPEQKRALITQIEDRMNQLANRANQRRIQVIGR